ncbi:hypothetical protein, partial [Mycobacterium pseudoshottsii]|uniref:hypothetical protein n=1 Tax=Mycobacterium pseudoshottsii TaxID=265949 RepID=UPI003F771834
DRQPPPRPPQSTIPQLTSLLINNAGALGPEAGEAPPIGAPPPHRRRLDRRMCRQLSPGLAAPR